MEPGSVAILVDRHRSDAGIPDLEFLFEQSQNGIIKFFHGKVS